MYERMLIRVYNDMIKNEWQADAEHVKCGKTETVNYMGSADEYRHDWYEFQEECEYGVDVYGAF